MEDTKYYTPSIDEFYVGFQCEIRLPDWQNFKKYQPLDFDTQKTKELLENGNIRCKYLDKSDIESCGFITEFKDTDYPILYTKDIYNIVHYYNDNSILIDNGKKRLFEGIIKNISELRKLLKQLGIE